MQNCVRNNKKINILSLFFSWSLVDHLKENVVHWKLPTFPEEPHAHIDAGRQHVSVESHYENTVQSH